MSNQVGDFFQIFVAFSECPNFNSYVSIRAWEMYVQYYLYKQIYLFARTFPKLYKNVTKKH